MEFSKVLSNFPIHDHIWSGLILFAIIIHSQILNLHNQHSFAQSTEHRIVSDIKYHLKSTLLGVGMRTKYWYRYVWTIFISNPISAVIGVNENQQQTVNFRSRLTDNKASFNKFTFTLANEAKSHHVLTTFRQANNRIYAIPKHFTAHCESKH